MLNVQEPCSRTASGRFVDRFGLSELPLIRVHGAQTGQAGRNIPGALVPKAFSRMASERL